MNAHTNFKLLESFFSGYFHEDWDLDADTTEDVARLYRSQVSAQKATEIADEIGQLLDDLLSEEDLQKFLFERLGCYYDPTLDGQTFREWLETLARLMRNNRQGSLPHSKGK